MSYYRTNAQDWQAVKLHLAAGPKTTTELLKASAFGKGRLLKILSWARSMRLAQESMFHNKRDSCSQIRWSLPVQEGQG
jgi:hypothetical protein